MSEPASNRTVDSLVLYCDLLGGKAVTEEEAEGAEKLLSHLIYLSKLQTDAERKVRVLEDRMSGPEGDEEREPKARTSVVEINTTLAFSSFSDSLVMSYPAKPFNIPAPHMNVHNLDEGFWRAHCLEHMREAAGKICKLAFEAGLLMRGGLARGNIYHRAGVVFGPGLIRAVTLEEEVAIYPRIVVAKDVAEERLRQHSDCPTLRCGADGLYELDYFEKWRDACIGTRVLHDDKRAWSIGGGKYSFDPTRETNWLSQTGEELKQRVEQVRKGKTCKAFTKWSWFQNAFNDRLTSPGNLWMSPSDRTVD